MSKAGKLRVPEYLGHILEAIRRIHLYVDDMSKPQFLDDPRTQAAVIRNFEIIGEACRNIDSHHPEFAQEHPEVPWGIAYECAMHLPMATSRWISKSSGQPFTTICRFWPGK